MPLPRAGAKTVQERVLSQKSPMESSRRLQRARSQVPVSWGPALGGDGEAGQGGSRQHRHPRLHRPNWSPWPLPTSPSHIVPALVPQHPQALGHHLPPVSHPSWIPPPLGYITGQSDMGERQRTSGLRAFLHLLIFPCFTSALHQTMVLERLKTHRGQGPVGQGQSRRAS